MSVRTKAVEVSIGAPTSARVPALRAETADSGSVQARNSNSAVGERHTLPVQTKRTLKLTRPVSFVRALRRTGATNGGTDRLDLRNRYTGLSLITSCA